MFIFATYNGLTWAASEHVVSLALILVWLWTGTGEIPRESQQGRRPRAVLPLYRAGIDAAGWWAMCITMIGVFAAFVSLLFGYFFYWTLDARFLREALAGPAPQWPAASAVMSALSWGLTSPPAP